MHFTLGSLWSKLSELLVASVGIGLLFFCTAYAWAHYLSATYNLGLETTYWGLAFMGVGILLFSLTLHRASGLKDLIGWLFASIILVCILSLVGEGLAGFFFLSSAWALPIVVVGAITLNALDQLGFLRKIGPLYEKYSWLWPITIFVMAIWVSVIFFLQS